jgi:hypothetical protein
MADDLTLLGNATSAIHGVTSVSTTYTVQATDTVLICNATSAGFAVTLPDATTCNGRVLSFVALTGSGHAVTLTPHAGQTVNGFGSFSFNINNWAAPIVSDGSNWHTQAGYGFTDNNVLDDGSGNMTIAGNIAMNSHKVTGLTNGSAGSDAAAFGQTLAGGNGSPLTTKGDLLTMNATPAPARLAVGAVNNVVGVSGGSPAWQPGFTLQAQTAAAGVSLINGTQTLASWTTPNDGNIHHFIATAYVYATSTMTGGQINNAFTDLAGNAASWSFISGGVAAGGWSSDYMILMCKANTTVTITQSTAMTAGAAKCWAEIWGC